MWNRLINSKNKHKHAATEKENTTSASTTAPPPDASTAKITTQALSNAWRSTAQAAVHGAQQLGLVSKQVCDRA